MNFYRKFINSEVSSRSDLENICERLGITCRVDWAENWDGTDSILNIGDDDEGTHWVVATKEKKYFDPFGLAPDSDIPSWDELQWKPFQVQSIDTGYCGQYCCLYLWYSQRGREDEFWAIFQASKYDR